VLIVSDDAGYNDFGFQGSLEFSTPRIDELARGGVTFSSGYMTASVCSPSRAAILTGRYQQRFGHEFNTEALDPDAEWGLPTGERTLARLLKSRGYVTAAIGKWHLGERNENHPTTRGFDSFYGFLGGGRDYTEMESPRRNKALLENKLRTEEPTYTTDDFTTRATAFIEANKASPFFLYLAYNAVHEPMQVKDEHLDMFSDIMPEERRVLAGMTYSLDENVGRVLDSLRAAKVYSNTMVIFINDNGGARHNASDNDPLRGHKGGQFEGGVRVPFLIKMPDGVGRGTEYHKPVSALDILPTVLAYTGEAPENVDGVNLSPYIMGHKVVEPHQALFWRRGEQAAVRKGQWKLLRTGTVQLYDVAWDIGETNDRAEARPDKVEELLALLEDWESTL
jgi:arylsulfatase A-like enzyme